MRDDYSEYLVVIFAYGDGEAFAGRRVQSLRCNRKETAEAIAKWLVNSEIEARVFSDPPKIGQ